MSGSKSKPTLDAEVAQTNAGFFFKEFSFSRTSFRPPEGTELELADHVVALGDRMIVFQHKERHEDPRAPGDSERERKWFEKKVLADATKQIRDTLSFLREHMIEVPNDRGRSTRLDHRAAPRSPRITKIILYRPGRNLPSECRVVKHHVSKSAGIIHVLSCDDWVNLLHTLVTPTEIIEYLDLREGLLDLYPAACKTVPEHALVGQFLVDMRANLPDAGFSGAVRRLVADYERFDITGILHSLGQKASGGSSPIPGEDLVRAKIERDYYPIMEGLARFGRSDCAMLKERFMLCWQRCREGLPFVTRFVSTATRIGVLLLAVPPEWEPNTALGLSRLTEMHKYDMQLRECIGISFSRHGDERFIGWMFLDYAWEPDAELAAEVATAPKELLPPLRYAQLPTYTFRE